MKKVQNTSPVASELYFSSCTETLRNIFFPFCYWHKYHFELVSNKPAELKQCFCVLQINRFFKKISWLFLYTYIKFILSILSFLVVCVNSCGGQIPVLYFPSYKMPRCLELMPIPGSIFWTFNKVVWHHPVYNKMYFLSIKIRHPTVCLRSFFHSWSSKCLSNNFQRWVVVP